MLKNEKMKRRYCLVLSVFYVIFACSFCAADIIYVDDDALGLGDGSSWSNAYTHLQDAITSATSGDEIRIAKGLYKPDQGQGISPGDKTASFTFTTDISIYGGYAGTYSVDPDSRDTEKYKTILTGDLLGNDEPNFVNYQDNSFNIIKTDAGSKTIIIDGLTVCSGNTTSQCEQQGGAAVYLGINTIFQADNCVFKDNTACKGGAVYSQYNTVQFTNCRFKNNFAHESGGAVSAENTVSNYTGCNFIGNSALGNGGAIEQYLSQGSSLTHCVFNSNSSGSNGGAVFGWKNTQTTKAVFTNCILYNNSSHLAAGGIVHEYIDLRNTILWANNRDGQIDQYTQFWNQYPLSEANISNCCIQGWNGDFPSVDTISDNPLFVDVNGLDQIPATDDDNFRLQPLSPCIDAGDSQFLPSSIVTDVDGFKRVLFDDVDLGLYEYYIMLVDDDAANDPDPNDPTGSDPDECGSPNHPFDTIQEAINAVEQGYTIVVMPGSYPDSDQNNLNEIDFKNKNFILKSTAPDNWDVVNKTIINGEVYFGGREDPNCKLLGFKIHNVNYGAIYGEGTQATISNCNISGNAPCGATVLMSFDGLLNNCLVTDNSTAAFCGTYPVIWGCNGIIRNCTIANNVSGMTVNSAIIENTIIYHNKGTQLSVANGDTASISYCDIQGGIESIAGTGDVNSGPGNFDFDPCFVNLGQWDMENVVLYQGDYHLKSFGWRINPDDLSTWTFDQETSRCIDAGNPGYSLKNELLIVPNDPESDYATNIRINMGAYGGTHHASLAPYDWSLLADLNNDGIVDFEDFSLMAETWLNQQQHLPADLDRNEIIDLNDYALLGHLWHKITDWMQ